MHTIAHQGRAGKPHAGAMAALAPAKRPNIVLSPMESPLAYPNEHPPPSCAPPRRAPGARSP